MLKILVVGNTETGKTAFIQRFVTGKFLSEQKKTVAGDYSQKNLKLQGEEFRLQIWDLVGMGNSISSLNNIFCRGAHGAICIADITNRKSLDDCVEWKNQLDKCVQLKNGDPLPMLLVINKTDLVGDVEE